MSEISTKLFKNFGNLMHQNHRLMGRMGMHNPMRHYSGQNRLLEVLKKNEGKMTTSQLAEVLDIRPSSVSELVGKLEKAEFIVRKKDEQDKRITTIELTEKGRHSLLDNEDKKEDFTEKFFSPLTKEEQEEFDRLIEKLLAASKERFGQEDFDQNERFGDGRPDFEGHGDHFCGHHHHHHHFPDSRESDEFFDRRRPFAKKEED